MSFSNQVKSEIKSSINNKDKRFACLYGILLYCKKMSSDEIVIQTENAEVLNFVADMFSEFFRNKIHLHKDEGRKIKNTSLCSFRIDNSEELSHIFELYEVGEREKILVDVNLKCAFLSGAFLICGSVNNPEKDYHLEFASPSLEKAEILRDILLETGISAKIVKRKNSHILYLKDSESIEDVLTYMGAQNCTLEIMNVKIYKDVRNRANRIANCDNANIDKVVNASTRQIADIITLKDAIGLENLPDELKEVALLRMENQEMSLKEIGESLSTPISRSGVNHRFRKLAKMAEEIRQKTEEKDEQK